MMQRRATLHYGPALAALVASLALAFAAAAYLQDAGLLSLTPPPSESDPTPAPDVLSDEALSLYQSAFTAWAALVLLAPVYAAYLFRRTSDHAWGIWLTFWTVSGAAYLVHLAVAMFGFFDGDMGRMTNTTRVSAFWPGMLVAVWWPIDVVLAHLRGEPTSAERIQRNILHLIVLILFVGGSLGTGELLTIKLLGAALLLVAGAATVTHIRSRRSI